MPWTLFTDPEIAQVGLNEGQACERYGISTRVIRLIAESHSVDVRAERNSDQVQLVETALELAPRGVDVWYGKIANARSALRTALHGFGNASLPMRASRKESANRRRTRTGSPVTGPDNRVLCAA